jgi:hypothetical protein
LVESLLLHNLESKTAKLQNKANWDNRNDFSGLRPAARSHGEGRAGLPPGHVGWHAQVNLKITKQS